MKNLQYVSHAISGSYLMSCILSGNPTCSQLSINIVVGNEQGGKMPRHEQKVQTERTRIGWQSGDVCLPAL